MYEFGNFISNATNIAIWVLVGPLFAVILFHLGEKRWGNGPTWAWLGMFFNVFALLLFLLLAGYETSEARSTGMVEARRIRQVMKATRGLVQQERQASLIEDGSHITVGDSDPWVEELLADHRPAEALTYARERYNVAFQTGDRAREALYGRYVADIVAQDEQLRARLAELQREARG
jgi:hypothetical protein